MATVIVNQNNGRYGKRYTEVQRRKAVDYKLAGHSLGETARTFGVSDCTIVAWLKKYGPKATTEVKMAAKVPMTKGWSVEKELLLSLLMEKYYYIKTQSNS